MLVCSKVCARPDGEADASEISRRRPQWGRHAVRRDQTKPLAVIGAKLAEGAAAQSQCFFQHCIEHRGKLAG
jgi:hypothetical protein